MRWLLIAIVVALSIFARDADACGLFSARPVVVNDDDFVKSRPYLSVERALILWDKETQEEDFVREARFGQANQQFGFVVPTPSKPEVAAVKDPPFDRLQKKMPFGGHHDGYKGASRGLGGTGAGAEPTPEPVQVLAQQRVGSFTAFTLKASDPGAFEQWLAKNGFVITDQARPWLAHYVTLEFYFVAFKYHAPASATKDMTSETVRIRFKTPKPYYPYMDATNPVGAEAIRSRLLLGWTITREAMIDVAAVPMQYLRWRRPWAHGVPYEAATAEDVKAALGAELAAYMPNANFLVVQPFRDQKTSRAGYGDVILVPSKRSEIFSPEDKEAHRKLLGVVDPVLIGERGFDQRVLVAGSVAPDAGDVAGPPAPPTSVSPSSGSPKGKGAPSCAAVPANHGSGAWFFALAAVAFVRRRSALAALALLSCKKPEVSPVDAAPSAIETSDFVVAKPATLPTRPLTSAERETAAFDVMMGEVPADGIPQDADKPTAPIAIAELEPSTTDGPKIVDADRVLASGKARFRQCYVRAVQLDRAVGPRSAIMHLTVASNGEVDAVRFDPGFSPDIATCVGGVARRLQFTAPEPAKKTQLTVKLSLKL